MKNSKSTYMCSFCELSFFTNERRIEHEKTCIKNGRSKKERFDEKFKKKFLSPFLLTQFFPVI